MMQGIFEPALQFLIDQDPLRLYKHRNWQQESDRFCRPNLTYPTYYSDKNFHGVPGGYLNIQAAVFYDAISQYLFLPNEKVVRHRLIESVQGQPERILDLGCGTGSTTLSLKKTFPGAEVIGLDLSPYMLAVAASKAQKARLNVQWMQGDAAQTNLPDGSFDLVTASLVLHETPKIVVEAILRESHRLLRDGGEIVILDGNQQMIRRMNWANFIFEEPYLADYATGDTDAWLIAVGFESIQTQLIWWMQQVSHAIKCSTQKDEL